MSAPQPQATTGSVFSGEAPAGTLLESALKTLAADHPQSLGDWFGQATQHGLLADTMGAGHWPSGFGAQGGLNSSVEADLKSACGPADGDDARLLALMRQDMSVFGAR